MHAQIKHTITTNHVSSWRNQYQTQSTTTRQWVKFDPMRVVDLLEDAKYRSLYDVFSGISAAGLLDAMKSKPWKIAANPHQGGRPGAARVDMNLHITLYIYTTQSLNNYTAYHLVCKEDPNLHIVRITR
jgi:hypothetical protein